MDDNSRILLQQPQPVNGSPGVQEACEIEIQVPHKPEASQANLTPEVDQQAQKADERQNKREEDFVDPFQDDSEIRFEENDISAISIHSENEQPLRTQQSAELHSEEQVEERKLYDEISAHVLKPHANAKAFPKNKIELVKVLHPNRQKNSVIQVLSGLKIQKAIQPDSSEPPLHATESPEIKAKVIGSSKPPIIPLLQLGKVHSVEVQQNEGPIAQTGLVLTQSLPTPNNDEAPTTPHTSVPSSRQWNKVSITKKRSTTQAPKPKVPSKPSLHNSVIANQAAPKEPTPLPLTYREQLMSSPCVGGNGSSYQGDSSQFNRTERLPGNKRRKAEPGEIIPLFDCLYCCQEHHVLQRISQKTMMNKYGENTQACNLYFISMLIKDGPLLIEEVQSVNPKDNNIFSQFKMAVKQSLELSIQTPQLARVLKQMNSKHSPKIQSEMPKANIPAQEQPMIDLDDPSFQLDGSRLNMKTRRQRILEQISFDTTCHNIYEPYFSSENDCSSEGSKLNSDQLNEIIAHGFISKRRQIAERELSSEEISSQHALSSHATQTMRSNESITDINQIQLELPQGEKPIRPYDIDCQSLSSIEMGSYEEQDGEEDKEASEVLEYRIRPMHIKDQSPVQMFVPELNLFGREASPRDHNKPTTFGALTPMGMTLGKPQVMSGPFKFIDDGSIMPPKLSTHKFNQDQLAGLALFAEEFKGPEDSLPDSIEGLDEGDQSPIPENMIVPADLSPVLPETTQAQRQRIQLFPRRLESKESDIPYPQRFNPQSNLLQHIDPPQQFDNSKDASTFSQQPIAQRRFIGDKESCFSPIQIEINDQSLSREGLVAASQAKEAINTLQGPCFSSIDFEDVTMVQNLPQSDGQQQSGLFGHREIAMTSNFAHNQPDPQYIMEDLTASDIAVRNMIAGNSSIEPHVTEGGGPLGSHTINLGYSNQYNQSFSAFHSKHLMLGNLNQTPIVPSKGRMADARFHPEVETFVDEPCISNTEDQIAGSEQLKKKKYFIKQDQLAQLLQKAKEKMASKKNAPKVSGNLYGDNTLSSSDALMFIKQDGPSLFDSLIQQQLVRFEDQPSSQPSELAKTSGKKKSANQVVPRHQKSIKTQDFSDGFHREGSQEDLRSRVKFSGERGMREVNSGKELKANASSKVIGLNQPVPKKLRIVRPQAEQSRQQAAGKAASSKRRKNQHSSFNHLANQAHPNGHPTDSQRILPTEFEEDGGPQTTRERPVYPELCDPKLTKGKFSVKLTDSRKIAVTPQFLMNAFKNLHDVPQGSNRQALTKEELNEFLRSAICSSRYSTSSNGMNLPPAALPSVNQPPSHIHNSTQKLDGLMRQGSIDRPKPSIHKHNHSSSKKKSTDPNAKQVVISPNRALMKNLYEPPLLTEGCEISTQRYHHNQDYLPIGNHYHQRSIDQTYQQTFDPRGSANRLANRKESLTKKWQATQNQTKFASQLMATHQTNNSVEKQKRKGLVNYASLDKHKQKPKKKPADQGSKERASKAKKKQQYLNDPILTQPESLALQNQRANAMHLVNQSGVASGFNTNNASNFLSKGAVASGVFNNHTVIQDSSNSNNLIINTMLATSGAQQCEMSTTISNNQLSLTRIQNLTNNTRGQSTGALNTQFLTKFVNQTVSSGSNQPSVINSTSIIDGKKAKVQVPQLQLSKINRPAPQVNSKRGKQLNGSQDEIQLQSLLQNLNQHLQTNQTRASIHQDTSSSLLRTPINLQMPQSNRIMMPQPTHTMALQANTKRSQVSSMSAQRQSLQAGKSRRKGSIEQPPPEFIQVRTAQLNKTMNRPSKKRAGGDYKTSIPLPGATVAQKDRKFKEPVNLAATAGLTKAGLQNSFTMKNLKQMMGALAIPQAQFIQNQLTTRMQESERVDPARVNTAECHKEADPKKSGKNNKKLLLNITQSSGGAFNCASDINRSSIVSQKSHGYQNPKGAAISKTANQHIARKQQIPSTKNASHPIQLQEGTGLNLLRNIPSASDLNINRLYDTSRIHLEHKASPSHQQKVLKFSRAPIPERHTLQPSLSSAKQQTMTLKSIFSKQAPSNASNQAGNQVALSNQQQVFNTFQA